MRIYDMDGNGIDDGLEIDNKTECEDGTEFGEAYWYPSMCATLWSAINLFTLVAAPLAITSYDRHLHT